MLAVPRRGDKPNSVADAEDQRGAGDGQGQAQRQGPPDESGRLPEPEVEAGDRKRCKTAAYHTAAQGAEQPTAPRRSHRGLRLSQDADAIRGGVHARVAGSAQACGAAGPKGAPAAGPSLSFGVDPLLLPQSAGGPGRRPSMMASICCASMVS